MRGRTSSKSHQNCCSSRPLDLMSLNSKNKCTVEKIRSCGAEIRDGVEDQRTGSVEHGLVMVVLKLAPTEDTNGRQPASGVGNFIGEMVKVIETDLQRIDCRGDQVATSRGAPWSAEVRGSMSEVMTLQSGRLSRSLFTFGDEERVRRRGLKRCDQERLDQHPVVMVDVENGSKGRRSGGADRAVYPGGSP
jgi:hypothetical protein